MNTVDIADVVTAREATALAEHWKNRALLYAQAAHDALAEIAALKARLAALEQEQETD